MCVQFIIILLEIKKKHNNEIIKIYLDRFHSFSIQFKVYYVHLLLLLFAMRSNMSSNMTNVRALWNKCANECTHTETKMDGKINLSH